MPIQISAMSMGYFIELHLNINNLIDSGIIEAFE